LIKKQIIVIGGGAAGFFAAINAAERHSNVKIILIEKSNKLLSKVRISGGGRCNVTHHCFDNNLLVQNYPRGHKELRQVFAQFSVQDTINWFNERGVKLKTEADGRMFPVSNSSETIIDCLMEQVLKFDLEIRMQEEVLSLRTNADNTIHVITSKSEYDAAAVICSSGGHNQQKNYQFLETTGHSIVEPVPSLFTINLPQSNITELMGVSVQEAKVRIAGLKHHYTGPVLITHWGLSGPAVLKLSAFAATDFHKLNYHSDIIINWAVDKNEDQIREIFENYSEERFYISKTPLLSLPKRLWEYLLEKSEISLDKAWNECGKKQLNKLSQTLTSDVYHMKGKTTFKEEFVTCGGVNRKEVDFKTMQSKIMPGLYFCGEVLDIDGITGGFNFQNAWSTAWVAANSLNINS
jgi:predicted Rossmann fold flavoprotein